MTRWFAALPIHRKLMTMSLAVSAAALVAALAGLIAFDVARFRVAAADDAQALAQVIAENAAAAIVFNDADAARQMLGSVEVRPVVSRACVYRADGSLLAAYQRTGAAPCPADPANRSGWRAVASVVPVRRNGREVGHVFVERLLSDLPGRVIVTTAAGLFMLVVAGALAFGLAHRLQRTVSRPIVGLARVARSIGQDPHATLPKIEAPPDETGELVRAFSDMVERLISSNEALSREVLERRRMEGEREALLTREREASRLKDEFLAAVSHELRTPLNAILGWTQILASTKPAPETMAKAIASLARNAQAQNRVIEDLLDISRIITGKMQLKADPVDLRGAVDSAMEVIAPVAAAKGVRLTSDVPPVACVVQGDFDRLRQVIWNLLSNGVKFTPAGGSVCVDLSEDGDSYALAVSDTGIGISPEFLPHVFERFRQADGSMTREHGGLGLGLAIVKEVTELHAGRVTAAHGPGGVGATFTVVLPRLVGASFDAGVEEVYAGPPVRLDGVSILVIDDNADALEVAAATLTAAGARVRVAGSGPEGIEQMQRGMPDIVLCDLAMPGMDGFAVLKWIQAASSRPATPALAVTAYASADHRDVCLRAGFRGHVRKPYRTADLLHQVATILARV